MPDVSLESSSKLPSREEMSAVQRPQVNQEQDSQKLKTASPLSENQVTDTEFQVVKPKKKPLMSLKDFPYGEIPWSWYGRENEGDGNIFRTTIADIGLKGDKRYLDHLVDILGRASNIICVPHSEFKDKLSFEYSQYFRNNPSEQKPTIEVFDNYLYHWAMKVWPRALDIIHETCRRYR